MTLLTTREALADHEPVLGVFAGRPGIVGCSCLSARDYRAAGYRAGQSGWREHLLASGVLVDAATLADDPVFVNTVAQEVADEPFEDMDLDDVLAFRDATQRSLRALAAALSEPERTREAART